MVQEFDVQNPGIELNVVSRKVICVLTTLIMR